MALALIFRDPEALSPRYIPERLPHRDSTLEELSFAFRNSFQSPEHVNLKVIQIIGPSGSGKTSCILLLKKHLEGEAAKWSVNFKFAYVNLKIYGESRVLLYRHILEVVSPELQSRGASAGEMLFGLIKYLRSKKLYLVLAFDELESWLESSKGDSSILYDLSRLNENSIGSSSNVLGVLFVSRSQSFLRNLDDAESSTLGTNPIRFKKYTGPEIKDILSDRISLAFQPNKLSEGVIDYVSNIAADAPYNGNARRALDLLCEAGNYAERQQAEKVIPDHVRIVVGRFDPAVTQDGIEDLPSEMHLLALLTVVISLRGRSTAYCSLTDIRAEAEVLERSRSKLGLVARIEDLIQDLSDRGILEIRSLREIGIDGVPLERLQSFLNTLFDRIDSRVKRS